MIIVEIKNKDVSSLLDHVLQFSFKVKGKMSPDVLYDSDQHDHAFLCL